MSKECQIASIFTERDIDTLPDSWHWGQLKAMCQMGFVMVTTKLVRFNLFQKVRRRSHAAGD